jgi:hypothetical protein
MRRNLPPPQPTQQSIMQGEEIVIATQNTRCLGHGFFGRSKRKEVQHLFKHTTPKMEILAMGGGGRSQMAPFGGSNTVPGISVWPPDSTTRKGPQNAQSTPEASSYMVNPEIILSG